MSKTIPYNIVQDKINSIHGNNILLIESTYRGRHIKAKFIDKDYGEWWSTPGNVLMGYGHKKRGYKERSDGVRLSVDQIQNRLNELYNGLIQLKKESYTDTHKKALFIDKDYGEWETTSNSVLAGHLNKKRGSINRQKTNLSR